jgi:hypothetical protein
MYRAKDYSPNRKRTAKIKYTNIKRGSSNDHPTRAGKQSRSASTKLRAANQSSSQTSRLTREEERHEEEGHEKEGHEGTANTITKHNHVTARRTSEEE